MGAFDLDLEFEARTASLKSQIANTQITTPKLHAGSLSVRDLTAVNITSSTVHGSDITGTDITGGTIIGSTFKTAENGDRVEIDSTNGIRLFNAADVVFIQIKGTVYAGIQVNGLRSIDANDIFMESQDQSAQLFVSSASDKISFIADSAERGSFDKNDGSGAGDIPTALTVRADGALRRVNAAAVSGGKRFLYY